MLTRPAGEPYASRRHPRGHPGRLPVAVALCLCLAAPVAARLQDTTHLAIDARQLSRALIQFSQQSGQAIVFSDRLTRNLPAPPVVGTFSAERALDTLLEGSGLAWKLVGDDIVAIYDGRCSGTASSCASAEDVFEAYPVYNPGIEETYVYGIQVTGSRIRRLGYHGGAPVDTLTAPDIELSGAQTLGELLKFEPAVVGNATSTAISNGGDGTATVTLRGLPASNTLVLVNGRRVANDGLAGESVDLNSIPPAAVERIEILKGGASAIYGSDAIAGVVNVIMKQDFYGFLAETFYGEAQEGDLETRTHTLQYGTGLPAGSLFFSASYYEQEPIFSRDRSVSDSADTRSLGGSDQRSSATPSARVVLPDGRALIAQGAGYRPATSEDLFDFADFTTAVVPLERTSLYGNASYDFNERVTGLVELSYVETEAEATLAPTPVFTAFEQAPLTVAADQVFNPFGVAIQDVRRRLLEFPERRQRNRSENTRFSAILEGLYADWNWDLGFNWSRSEATETSTGIVNADRLRRALGPAAQCQGPSLDGCVPVDLLGEAGSIGAAQVAYIGATGEVSGYSKLSGLSANISNALFDLPAGRGDFALGFEFRHESTRKQPSQLLASAATIGAANLEPTRGDRNVLEIYAETVLPLWKSGNGFYGLDMDAALRHSRYNDFGHSTNPQLGLRLQLGPSLLLRARWGEGFRAPSLNQLYEGTSEEQAFLSDPCAVQANVGVLPGCGQMADPTRNQFLTLKGGNEDLKPETADVYSAGAVWSPQVTPGLTLSADWFRIEQQDVVDSSAQYILDQNAFYGRFPDEVERDEQGNLTLISAGNINVGERTVSGVDLAFAYHYPRQVWGQLSLSSSATWMDAYLTRADSAAPEIDLVGTFRDEASEGLGGIPEWKARLGIRWSRERWMGSYDIHTVSAMEEEVPGTTRKRDIDAWTVHDLQLSYKFDLLQGLRWTLGVDNMLDEEAPLAASAFNDNIDGRTHELKGRFWYTKLSQRF